MIQSFINKGFLFKVLNRTYISLFPKKDKPEKVCNYRPISLCIISYKLISKLLPNILRAILPKLISPLQSAFVPNKDIYDNILVAHEILSSLIKDVQKRDICQLN